MVKSLYVATLEAHSGKSLVVLGLMEMLLGKMGKVGYFRPVIDQVNSNGADNHIETVINHFNIDIPVKESYALTQDEVLELYNEGKSSEILDRIINTYKNLEKRFDFILIEGTDFYRENNVIELDLNRDIAKNLGSPVILVDNAKGKSLKDFCSSVVSAVRSYKDKGLNILGVIANKTRPENTELVITEISKELDNKTSIYSVPRHPELSHPTIMEIRDALMAEVLFGKNYLNNQTGSFGVGAMQLANYLKHLSANGLVITPGDRSDIILGALQANSSANYPAISGILLTGGIKPEESIMKLLEGSEPSVPILSVKQGTFATTNAVGNIKSKIYAKNKGKINTSIALFNKHINRQEILEKLETYEPKIVTPRMFQYNLALRAQAIKKRIVLPEGEDLRILQAASNLQKTGVVDLILLGNKEEIEKNAILHGLNLKGIAITDPYSSSNFDDYVITLYELRKHKGITMDAAKDLMQDISYFGTMMVYKGDADGMVSGAIHTTQHTIRPALQFIKTKPNSSIVSSIFFMCLENRVSVFGDCAINPNPTAIELAEIAISSADTAKAFNIEPKIAMLSYSSGASGIGEDVDRVRQATDLVKEKRKDLNVEGPIQYDAAVDPIVGKKKLPNSKVAGQASVLIFPDLNTGNNTYKAVQRETGALAIGPILQGLNKPVNDLSRGCTIEDIFNTVIVTAIQAQEQ
ncbi:phosphate acetyltransferase [uncultured Maribacter sp.]|uniref:phosphate acetyltransferase n=1 Tax=uncultured Maribacter sp. TaxID=431308 RepID=UPI00261AA4B6|nr:phosphate acetyltransferase [uncultured Maribacter sp.]